MRADTTRMPIAIALLFVLLALAGRAAAQMPIDLTGHGGWKAHRLTAKGPGDEVELGVLRIADDGRVAFEGLSGLPHDALDGPLRLDAGAAGPAPASDAIHIDPTRVQTAVASAKAGRSHLVTDESGAVRHVIEWFIGACTTAGCRVETVVIHSLDTSTLGLVGSSKTWSASETFPLAPGDLSVGGSRP